MLAGRHGFEEHTGEVRIWVEAPDLAGLFREAGLALAELMAPDAQRPDGAAETIELSARDAEALLVDFLDELIYRTDTTGRVYNEIEVERADSGGLSARVRGVVPAEMKTAVKAATFHGLRIEESDGLWRARVVLDV